MKGILDRATSHLDRGLFWDLGAGDGRNTIQFFEKSWRGLLVEAAPLAFSRLHANYVSNEHIILVNAAIGLEHRFAKFWDCGGETWGTTDPDCKEKWTRTGVKFSEYYVPLVTVREIMENFAGAPNLISITLGALSFQILQQIPIKSWLPAAMVLEHAEQSSTIAEWGRSRYYEVGYLDATKIILVHREWIGKVKR